jgi:hypothetical protein
VSTSLTANDSESLAPDDLHDDGFEVVEAELDASLAWANAKRHAKGILLRGRTY